MVIKKMRKRNKTTIGMGRKLSSILIDEIAFRLVEKIYNRTKKYTHCMPAMCISSGDLIGHRLLSTGTFEASQLEALDCIIESRFAVFGRDNSQLDVFLDIGANIGIYSVRYSPYFKRVLAIEPNPITYRLLEANLILGQCKNTVPLCFAASSHEGTSKLTVRQDGNLGWSSLEHLSRDQDVDHFELDVVTQTLEVLAGKYAPGSRVDLVKVDVEGHEVAVLEGAQKILIRDKPVVLYERSSLTNGRNIDEILKNCGYQHFAVFERCISPKRFLSGTDLVMVQHQFETIHDAALVCAF